MLIRSFSERKERQAGKRQAVMDFMLAETWTGFEVAQRLLGLSAPATLRTLAAMERDGLLRRHRIPELRLSVWGITHEGAVMTAYEQPEARLWQVFEPGKVKPLAVVHRLATHEARLRAQDAGWSCWVPSHLLPTKQNIQPDGVVNDGSGRKIAVEVERTVKTRKRYAAIFSAYLRLIKEGQVDLVHYVCPKPEMAPRLARMFSEIKALPVLGERVPFTERHRARFLVFPLTTWPGEGAIDIFERAA